jgi:hypothetical protein
MQACQTISNKVKYALWIQLAFCRLHSSGLGNSTKKLKKLLKHNYYYLSCGKDTVEIHCDNCTVKTLNTGLRYES